MLCDQSTTNEVDRRTNEVDCVLSQYVNTKVQRSMGGISGGGSRANEMMTYVRKKGRSGEGALAALASL
jgi:hypothetical protein